MRLPKSCALPCPAQAYLAAALVLRRKMYNAHMESVSIEQDMRQRSLFLRTLVTTQLRTGRMCEHRRRHREWCERLDLAMLVF